MRNLFPTKGARNLSARTIAPQSGVILAIETLLLADLAKGIHTPLPAGLATEILSLPPAEGSGRIPVRFGGPGREA